MRADPSRTGRRLAEFADTIRSDDGDHFESNMANIASSAEPAAPSPPPKSKETSPVTLQMGARGATVGSALTPIESLKLGRRRSADELSRKDPEVDLALPLRVKPASFSLAALGLPEVSRGGPAMPCR